MVGARGSAMPLTEYRPQAAALLRILLLGDPMVRLVIQGLKSFADHSASFAELAVVCDQLDHARAPIFFLNPESAAALADERGHIKWHAASGRHYRSRMFYQYKSILKHAGVLRNLPLGGATTKGYDPNRDIWALR